MNCASQTIAKHRGKQLEKWPAYLLQSFHSIIKAMCLKYERNLAFEKF